jgi:hypothetical protein
MNMSHCRFQNTAQDFSDCHDALRDSGLEYLSDRERDAFIDFALHAQDFVLFLKELLYMKDEDEYNHDDLQELVNSVKELEDTSY